MEFRGWLQDYTTESLVPFQDLSFETIINKLKNAFGGPKMELRGWLQDGTADCFGPFQDLP